METNLTTSLAVTDLLRLSLNGDRAAQNLVYPAVFGHLRRIAAGYLWRPTDRDAIGPTELVHEAYIRLTDHCGRPYENRDHFYATAAVAMRNHLTDLARRRKAIKRNWGVRVPIENEALSVRAEWPERMIQFDEAMRQLAEFDPRAAQVVQLRLLGLTFKEIAPIIQRAEKTAKRDFRIGKAWFESALDASEGAASKGDTGEGASGAGACA